ncbi:MAG: hypothetical protein AAFY83_13460 [Pseudomonadota bacterium]
MRYDYYHTTIRPKARNGMLIKPLDLVVLGDIPEHYWADEGFRYLKEYAGCYGLVTYHSFGDCSYAPFYNENKDHPGWVNGEGTVLCVESKRIDRENQTVTSWQFWMPSSSLLRIPFNSLIMNIFVEYPWQMREVDGPSDYLFIRSGIPEYEHIKKIMDTPYEKLVEAHNAAMDIVNA